MQPQESAFQRSQLSVTCKTYYWATILATTGGVCASAANVISIFDVIFKVKHDTILIRLRRTLCMVLTY